MRLRKYFWTVLVVAGMAMTQSARAFPSEAEIKTATGVVGDLVAEDVRAANAGKAKRAEVAEKIYGYVDQAETDAAKWVLLKHAFIQYAKDGNFEKAGAVMSETLEMFPDMPPQTVIALIDKNCPKANAKNAPVLTKIRKVMVMRQKCKGVIALGKASKTAKAEAYCLMGNWEKGLAMFEEAGDKVGEIAAGERDGGLPKHAIADFWWEYKSELDTCDQFKSHAAEIYKAGLADSSITGLYKNVAEKRIAEMEAVPTVAAPEPKTTGGSNLAKLKKVCDTRGLVHCWRFNGDLKDCIGGGEAKCFGNAKVDEKQASVLGSHQHDRTSWIELGPNLLPTDGSSVTIELWATHNRVQRWARIFSFGKPDLNNIWMTWSYDWSISKNETFVRSGSRGKSFDGGAIYASQPYDLGVEYHIALVLERYTAKNWKMTICKQNVATGTTIYKESKDLASDWTLKGDNFPASYLGRPSVFNGDSEYSANASYNEVRIWKRALSEQELTQNAIKFHKAGETIK